MLGEIDLLMPVLQSPESLLFIDIIGRADLSTNAEGNIGIGYRRLIRGGWNLVAGGYLFADVRRTKEGNLFYQATLGAEALTETWEARVNAYAPELTEKGGSASGGGDGEIVVENNDIFMLLDRGEVALPGFDLEAGFRRDLGPQGLGLLDPSGPLAWLGRRPELRGLLGGYWFDRRNVDAVAGPRARLELRFDDMQLPLPGSRLAIGIEAQWDQARDGQVFGLMSLSIPFGNPFGSTGGQNTRRQTRLERRMTEPVRRDVDVVTGPAGSSAVDREAVINPHTNEEVRSVYFAREGASGSGVEASPTDLDTAIAEAGEYSMVVVDGNGGTVNRAATATLAQGQILLGGAADITLTGALTGRSGSYTAPGARPTINGTNAGADILTLAREVVMRGLTLTGGNNAVWAETAERVKIEDLTVSGSATAGIVLFNGSDNGAISDVTVSNTGTFGINVTTSSNVSVQNAALSNTGSDGFWINIAPNTQVSGSTIDNPGRRGVTIRGGSNNTVFSGNSITNPAGNAAIVDGSSDVSFANNTIDNVPATAIAGSFNTRLTISGNAISNVTFQDAIEMRNATDLTISGNTMQSIFGRAVLIRDSAGVTISDNTIDTVNQVMFSTGTLTGLGGTGNRVTNFVTFCGFGTSDGSFTSFVTNGNCP